MRGWKLLYIVAVFAHNVSQIHVIFHVISSSASRAVLGATWERLSTPVYFSVVLYLSCHCSVPAMGVYGECHFKQAFLHLNPTEGFVVCHQ